MKTALFLALAGAMASSLPARGQNPNSLSRLLDEALRNNSDLHAAERAWRAATHLRAQVTALHSPQFTLQEFSVGSPRPFAGLDSSNFAYIGVGASQELPYPGKRQLKGQAADAAANVQQSQIGVLQASITEQLKIAYFRLAYFQQTLKLLESSRDTLGQVIDTEITRYSAGQGSQMEVLNAQLERTKLVREITMHDQEMAESEADLKQLVHRPQDSPDILPEELSPTVLHYSSQELLDFIRKQNPEIRMEKTSVTKQDAELRSAEREGKPDFSIGYMYQRTGLDFPAYYMVTFGMTLPRRSRVHAELSEAAEALASAKEHLDAVLQRQLADAQKQYAVATRTAELLTQYREGLIPQADALFHAGLVGYQSNKQPLDSVLAAFNEGLELKRDYQQTLLDHELAIAHLESITREALR